MRESFVFYHSFYEAISQLWDESQFKIYQAIFCYQFEWVEPQLEWVENAIRKLIKPQLDANNQKYQNWKKGWAPKGNTNAKKTTSGWLNKTTEKQPKNNQKQANVNVNVNDNVNENDISSNEETQPAVEFGNSFLNQFISKVEKIYDDSAMEIVIDRQQAKHWINTKTWEVAKTKQEFMDKHGYKDVYDMITDMVSRIKTMKFGQWWASSLDKLRDKRADILNNTKDTRKIWEKWHFDWYLANVVDKVEYDDYWTKRFYQPESYSTYLQNECGIDRAEAQELRDKFLTE